MIALKYTLIVLKDTLLAKLDAKSIRLDSVIGNGHNLVSRQNFVKHLMPELFMALVLGDKDSFKKYVETILRCPK